MTDEQLKQGKELKQTIEKLENELEKFGNPRPIQGINVFLPNIGTLIDDVKGVFIKYLNEYNDKFRKL